MRTLMRWHPMRDMTIVRRQLDQLFDELNHLNLDGAFVKPQELGNTWLPAIEVRDTETDLIVRAALPGVTPEELDVQVTRAAITISGEHRAETQTETQGRFRSEFQYGKFRRVVPLRIAVKHEQVQAEFQDGILTLTLPKADSDRAVKVQFGNAQAKTVEITDASEPAV